MRKPSLAITWHLFVSAKSREAVRTFATGAVLFATAHVCNAALPSVEFSYVNFGADESHGTAAFDLRRSGDTNAVVSVSYATVDGTARAGVDYVASSNEVIFNTNEVSKIVEIPLIDNGRFDGRRTLKVILSNPVGATLGSQSSIDGEIGDDELPFIVDPAFRVSTDGDIRSVAVLPDGRLIVGGSFTRVDGVRRQGLARLNSDGSLDQSFEAPPLPAFPLLLVSEERINAQNDGKLLVGITACGKGRGLLRLHPDGALDSSFVAGVDACNTLRHIAALSDGRILLGDYNMGVLALSSNGSINQVLHQGEAGGDGAFALQPDGKILLGGAGVVRLHADGSLDQSFSARVEDPEFQPPDIRILIPQTNGQIVIAGKFQFVNDVPKEGLARLNSDGSVDTSFEPATRVGTSGWVTSGAVQPDGRILMSFYLGYPSTPLIRFNLDGSVDPLFRTGPYRVLALQKDGKVIVGRQRLFGNPEFLKGFTLSHNGDFEPPQYPAVAAVAGHTVGVLVRRLGETTATATVDFTTRDGTALASRDYAARHGTLTFAPLENVKFVNISILENELLREERTFSVVLTNTSPGNLLGLHSEATITVIPSELFLRIHPPSPHQRTLSLTLFRTVPGVHYQLHSSRNPQFIFDPLDPPTIQDKQATSDSLDFENIFTVDRKQRFFRAIRVD